MPETAAISLSPDALPNTGGVTTQEPSAAILHMRALAIAYNKTNPFYELESGDLLIKDVPLLAEGQWTDSAQKTPLYYTAKALETYAGNWSKKTGYNRHYGGVPRDDTNRVSEAINPHYGQFSDAETGQTHNAIISDLLVYGSTPQGRAMQEMIKRKNINYVSVEHTGEEEYNPETRRLESRTLDLSGWAFVSKGACKVCRINEAPPVVETPVIIPEDHSMAELKELEDKIAALTKELSDSKAQKPTVVNVEIPKELSDAVGMIKELAESNVKMAAQIKALEQDGTPRTEGAQTKELEAEPMNARISIDRKAGTIRRV